MPHGIRQRLFNNAGTKIVALCLAIFLYLHVFVSQENEVVMEIPLELAGVPEGLTWSGVVPEAVRVRFRGVGLDLLKMRAQIDRARLVVEVGDVRAGHYQRPLVSEDVLLPADLNVQAVEVERPHEISLEFNRVLVKNLQVAPRIAGRVAPGYTVHGRIVVEPESVLVRGPADVLQAYERIPTEVIDVGGEEDLVTQRVALAVGQGCEAVPSEVTVRVTIEQVVSRTFVELPIEVLRSRGVQLKRLVPGTGSVAVSGPVSVVESLAPRDLRVSIEARGLPPGGTYTLMASVELRSPSVAGSLSIEPVQPEKFEIELE
ncbi:MAG: CdaR family protein [Candidatus Eisenbacteria bacterium]